MKVTNTGNQPLFLGGTQIAGKATVEIPDDELAEAKKNKMVESWFANGTLKSGEPDQTKPAANVSANVPGTGNPGGRVPGSPATGQPAPGGAVHTSVKPDDKK